MARIHLFETGDLSFVPKIFHDTETDLLRFMLSTFNPYEPAFELIKNTLEKCPQNEITDLCSGGGGPIANLLGYLKHSDLHPTLKLTDLYPNEDAFNYLEEEFPQQVKGIRSPVNCLHIDRNLKGMRLLFSSFHHFKWNQARQILQDAIDAEVPIGIFEVTERKFLTIFNTVLFAGILSPLLFTPFAKPFKWQKLLWTYVIPVMISIFIWNGLVSCLRTYSPVELGQMISELNSTSYHWEIKQARSFFKLFRVTMLIGYPVKK